MHGHRIGMVDTRVLATLAFFFLTVFCAQTQDEAVAVGGTTVGAGTTGAGPMILITTDFPTCRNTNMVQTHSTPTPTVMACRMVGKSRTA